MTKILVTGAAGFIGYHLATRLLAQGHDVIGLDNLSPYYDVALKQARLQRLVPNPAFRFVHLDLASDSGMRELFARERPEVVVNLAAQPGVRYSLTHPHAYASSNLHGFLNVLEGCRATGVAHLVYASSSSVYGANTKMPFATTDPVDHPVSLYAATKKANELMAHTYSHLYAIPSTGLRFFTVYGPWGRPDMAYFSFTRAILAGEPIDVFNQGAMQRDFTYVDDVIEGIARVIGRPPAAGASAAGASPADGTAGVRPAPYRLYNIGSHDPVSLTAMIGCLEVALGRTAVKRFLPMQPGDVVATYADVADLERDIGFRPTTSLETGIGRFVEWYLSYYAPPADSRADAGSA